MFSRDITLKDTAENLEIGLKAFTEGQTVSFNYIKVSDSKKLNLDAATFKKLDNSVQSTTWSDTDGVQVVNNNNSNADIVVSGSTSELLNAGLITSSGAFTTKLNDNDTNLVVISTYNLTGDVTS